MATYLDIAVGVLHDNGRYCMSLRQKHQSHAGRWEFPGGKVEVGETPVEALKREFVEELAIQTDKWRPLIEIPWHYENVSVRLHVFLTSSYQGEPVGNEGQKVDWFGLASLKKLALPQANKGIIQALELTDKYLITGGFVDTNDALQKLKQALDSGIKLCQFRAKQLSSDDFKDVASKAISLCHQYDSKLLLNGGVELLEALPEADGIQLSSNAIYEFDSRPITKNKLLGVSTHTREDIEQALKLEADFILLSPVKATTSHPGVEGIGWRRFAENVRNVPIPVYALGGMLPEDITSAQQNGAQGIAAISAFWPE